MNGHTNGANGEEAVALPSTSSYNVSEYTVVQPPLTRRGHGPGLLLVVPSGLDLASSEKTVDPPPLQKWAEEGFAVAQLTIAADGSNQLADRIDEAVKALKELKECDSADKLGVICKIVFDLPTALTNVPPAYNVSFTPEMISALESRQDVVAIVNYGTIKLSSTKPQQWHLSGSVAKLAGSNDTNVKMHEYADCSPYFVIPAHDNFRSAPAGVSHTRCLQFLKPLIGGPYFDLEAIWDEHTAFEFGERAVEKTMGTMVQEPYVNHIPTITGGIGRRRLTDFYRHHFVFNNPADTAMELVSRTVGIDRVIDEFIFSFTHDKEIDWM